MDRRITILLLLLGLIIAGCVGTKDFPIKGIGLAKCEVDKPYSERVSYPDVEYYIETEPYQTNVSYTEKECNPTQYIERECNLQNLTYNISNEECISNITNCKPPNCL